MQLDLALADARPRADGAVRSASTARPARRHRPHARHPLAPAARDPDRLPQPEGARPGPARSRTRCRATTTSVVPSRTVHLPLSWDDPATREAIARYMAGVRDDAPWCPWNIEFIRRVNGLDSVDDVYRTVFDAEYLVLGLGDVYLGAPVATPLDPRHRLVTTKYNPARTWTAENSVGIGGAYLCIYGMEGPGGYQFVGRTTQVWGSTPGRRSSRAPRGCCGSSTGSGGTRWAPTNCWTCARTSPRGASTSRIEPGDVLAGGARAVPGRQRRRRSRRSARSRRRLRRGAGRLGGGGRVRPRRSSPTHPRRRSTPRSPTGARGSRRRSSRRSGASTSARATG